MSIIKNIYIISVKVTIMVLISFILTTLMIWMLRPIFHNVSVHTLFERFYTYFMHLYISVVPVLSILAGVCAVLVFLANKSRFSKKEIETFKMKSSIDIKSLCPLILVMSLLFSGVFTIYKLSIETSDTILEYFKYKFLNPSNALIERSVILCMMLILSNFLTVHSLSMIELITKKTRKHIFSKR